MMRAGLQFFGVWGLLALPAAAGAQGPDWDTVSLIRHDTFQVVNPDGSCAYPGDGFPVRLRGIVLNNPEDWYDSTAAYDPGFTPWIMGGEWEIFVQAVDLPDDTYDDDDISGTAAWMGQNYGNLPWLGDPFFSYTDAEWQAEMQRLNYPDGPDAAPLRAGDLVELRARGGLHYQGKMNVNEQHNNDRDPDTGVIGTAHDFEIVRLQADYGLPIPAAIRLRDLKDDADVAIFDPTRATGGERYQSTLVEIQYVSLLDAQDWGTNADLVLADATGRTFEVHLGRNASFAETPAPTGYFDVIGFVNQASSFGVDGYYLMAMHAEDFAAPAYGPGDVNCDGTLNAFDIDPFVVALGDPEAYAAAYPDCDPATADVNVDHAVNAFDIDPFVVLLTSP